MLKVKRDAETQSDHSAEPKTFVPICPVCSSLMQQAGDGDGEHLFACDRCLTKVTVPVAAWAIALENRQRKWPKKL